MASEKVSNEKVIEALEANCGNISAAARALGYTRQGLWDRIQKNENLKAAMDNAKETIIDVAECEIVRQITEEHNLKAAMFILETKGKKRGWSKNKEDEGNGLFDFSL